MSIVLMSKLRAVVPKHIRRPLIKELTKLGCVEIGSSADRLAEAEWAPLLEPFSNPSDAERRLGALVSARGLLDKYVPGKTPFLAPRRQISEREFQDEETIDEACAAAGAINELGQQLTACASEGVRLASKRASFLPWLDLDVPLDIKSGKHYKAILGISPADGAAPQDLINEVSRRGRAELWLISGDLDQNYFFLMAHNSVYGKIMAALRPRGFSIVDFKDARGTAGENIARLQAALEENACWRQKTIEKIMEFGGRKAAIEHAIDVYTIESERDKVISGLAGTKKTLLIEGWVPREREDQVAGILKSHACAFKFEEPPEDCDDVPVLLKNNRFVTPFTAVTELYSLPSYRSVLDPNPLMAPFFCAFFGVMVGDISYGVMITLVCWLILRKKRPPAGTTMRHLLQLGFICGISGAVWGVLFGGLFGDAILAVGGGMFGLDLRLRPVLFDPLNNPTAMLVMSLAFGFIHVSFGLCIDAYQKIRKKRVADAVCDDVFHLVFLAGVPLALINTNVGLGVLAAGASAIVLTGGRARAGVIGKAIGGLGSIYNCATGYLADILSYSRLLGLCLATAVIAQVMNAIATMVGPTVLGWVVCVPVFVFGHIFNVAISIVGTFVHSSRLQFVEFYSKFYEGGGRAFRPLFNKTKYVELVKEDV